MKHRIPSHLILGREGARGNVILLGSGQEEQKFAESFLMFCKGMQSFSDHEYHLHTL